MSNNAKASRDSEEGAQITNESSSRIDGSQTFQQATSEPSKNGHLDPKQRKIYLTVFSISVGSALIGLILILLWMLKFRPKPGFSLSEQAGLANLHPLLMYTFMVSLNMYAVLIYRTHFNLPKQQLKWMHAIISGVNIVMSLVGVAAMYKAHLLGNIPNFYSLHSWIGSLTNTFYLLQFVSGFVVFLKPGLSINKRVSIMPWHRMSGSMILVLAALAAITGMTELVIFQDGTEAPYSKFMPITFIANFAGISVVLMTASTIYLLTATQYLRPSQPEELPLRQ